MKDADNRHLHSTSRSDLGVEYAEHGVRSGIPVRRQIPEPDRSFPRRTLNDCAREAMAPDLLRQAAQQAIRRGLAAKAELGDVDEALRPFGGLGA